MLASMRILRYLDYRPKYDVNKCIKSKSTKSSCEKCYQACPYDAIELYKKGIEITDKCNFCGICVAYCPSNAISDGGRRFCRNGNEMFVACSQQEKEDIDDEKIIVHCLNFFTAKIFLNLYSRGIRKIYINSDKCEDCLYGHNIEKELNFTNEILKVLEKPLMEIEEVGIEEIYEGLEISKNIKSETLIDRRSFFKEIAKEVFNTGYDIAPPIVKEQGWEELSKVIKKLETEEIKGVSLFKVKKDFEKCIECNACIKLCSQKVWKEENEGLKTEIYNCNGCGLCQDICPTKAISIDKNVHISQMKIEEKIEKICNLCEKEFSTRYKEKDSCSKCVSSKVFNKSS